MNFNQIYQENKQEYIFMNDFGVVAHVSKRFLNDYRDITVLGESPKGTHNSHTNVYISNYVNCT